jgi:TFIIF-interacting CTD phosphatase-like protein
MTTNTHSYGDGKKLVLIDLDNTIICSEDLSIDDSKTLGNLDEARKNFKTVRMEDYYDVFERPHLQEFLDYLFGHFKVGVWTASSKDYAIFVIKNFITHPNGVALSSRHIHLFLCSHHCNVSKKHFKGVSKDLKLLSEKWGFADLKDMILIDDLEKLATHQPSNVVWIRPFFYDRRQAALDDELLRVKESLQKLEHGER